MAVGRSGPLTASLSLPPASLPPPNLTAAATGVDHSLRPAWIELDLEAIRHNTRQIRSIVGSGSKLMAVVKANAYGHGAVPVARACLEAGAHMLAVALVQEGVELRQAGLTAPILVVGTTDHHEAEAICEFGLTPSVSTWDLAAALSATAVKQGLLADCHIKIDSGMGRQGVRHDECEVFGQRLCDLPALRVAGAFSHFASCPADVAFTDQQVAAFLSGLASLERGLQGQIPLRHLAASAGILCRPDAHLDGVRPGAILYGVADSGYEDHLPRFRPAMALKARIVSTKRLHVAESVGYGRTFRAPRETTTALLSLGYADGIPRALSNNADVLIRGQRCPLIGRVSMDCIVVDIGDVLGAQVGDEAVLLGAQGPERITAEELAQRAGTCVQEIVSRMGARLPRTRL